eukprot:scpid88758/ scgid5124/ 
MFACRGFNVSFNAYPRVSISVARTECKIQDLLLFKFTRFLYYVKEQKCFQAARSEFLDRHVKKVLFRADVKKAGILYNTETQGNETTDQMVTADGFVCAKDVDECQMPTSCPMGFACINTKGSYRCKDGKKSFNLSCGGFIVSFHSYPRVNASHVSSKCQTTVRPPLRLDLLEHILKANKCYQGARTKLFEGQVRNVWLKDTDMTMVRYNLETQEVDRSVIQPYPTADGFICGKDATMAGPVVTVNPAIVIPSTSQTGNSTIPEVMEGTITSYPGNNDIPSITESTLTGPNMATVSTHYEPAWSGTSMRMTTAAGKTNTPGINTTTVPAPDPAKQPGVSGTRMRTTTAAAEQTHVASVDVTTAPGSQSP